MPANAYGYPYPLPTDPVAQGAAAIKALADFHRGPVSIGEIDLASVTSFTAIPTVFDHLRLVIVARSSMSATVTELYIRANDVSSASYFGTTVQWSNVETILSKSAQTQAHLGPIPGATGAGGHYASVVCDLPNSGDQGGGAARYIVGTSFMLSVGNVGDITTSTIGYSMGVAVPITKLTLLPAGVVPFVAGSRAWLYGYGGA